MEASFYRLGALSFTTHGFHISLRFLKFKL